MSNWFDRIIKKPRALGITAIALNLIPTWWTFFFFITIPIILLGVVFLFLKPRTKAVYEVPAGILIFGIGFGLLMSVVSIIEIVQI
ncbi:hypothetical protein POKO110462_22435 [Pontibacter korlensis]|uniref:Uncharacterized protein n=1 Tax=Pontibacter korlensis TaxID=400092 RepID=A0A0E3UWD0_9BACT|nr:hypothetical protein [Pontibacter korlensis]AKD03302.1 hypothetical protein PKOR_09420 [Pontibacter korlensis]